MEVSLNSLLEKNGLSVSSGMSADKMLLLFSKIPSFLSLFPSVSSAVNTLNTLWELFNKAKDTLGKMESALTSAEKALNKAQQLQTFVASQAKPIAAAPGNPCAPDVATGVLVQSALTLAQNVVDEAKKNVDKAKSEVQKAEDKVKGQINNIVKKVFSEKITWQS
jgi:prefoldin subunit 5